MVRQWQPREMRMVSEFLAQEYPGFPYQTHVRLGSIRPRIEGEFVSDEESRMLGVFRRWADAIVFMPDRLLLIEAAIRPEPGDVSKLKLYERLIPNTPELAEYRDRPIEKMLLYCMPDDVLLVMAREEGIQVRYFRPAWVEEYLAELYPRERRAPYTPLD